MNTDEPREGTVSNSPLVHAVEEVQSVLKASHVVLSYCDDFVSLWELDGRRVLDPDEDKTIIVIWDGWPDEIRAGVVDMRQYLTPIDWAVAFSIKACNGGPTRRPRFRVLILDLVSEQVRDAPSVRFYRSFSSSIPWIRLVQEQEGIIPYLVPHEEKSHLADTDQGADLDTLARYWHASLLKPAEPGHHHALANVLGPLILSKGMDDLRARALRRMMEWIGLLSEEESCSEVRAAAEGQEEAAKEARRADSWVRWDEESFRRIPEMKGRPLNLLLVDDCAFEHGWARVLCEAVGAESSQLFHMDVDLPAGESETPNIRVYAIESPLECLKRMGMVANGKEAKPPSDYDCRFNLRYNNVPVDILFLDLRLHQESTISFEKEFYNALLPLAKPFTVAEKGEMQTHEG